MAEVITVVTPPPSAESISVIGRRLLPQSSLMKRVIGTICLYRPLNFFMRWLLWVLFKRREQIEVRLSTDEFFSISQRTTTHGGTGERVELIALSRMQRISYVNRNNELQNIVGLTALGVGSMLGVYWTGLGIWASPMSLYLVIGGISLFLLAFLSEFLLSHYLHCGSRLSFFFADGTQYSLSPDEPEDAEALLSLLKTMRS